jgi:putative phage-type endonuclease
MSGRDQFLQSRRTGVGGSDIAAILGLSRYKSAVEVYQEKRGELGASESSERMYWGVALEDLIAREYARRHQTRVWNRPTFRHARYEFAVANIDRAVHTVGWAAWDKQDGGKTGLECKTADKANALEWGEEGSDQIPVEYLLQCQWYLFVCEAERWDVALLLGGNDYREYRIARDDDLIGDLIEAAGSFWEGVQSGTPPQPKTSEDLAYLYRRDSGKTVEADSTVACAVADLKATREQIKQLTETEERQCFAVKTYMADAAVLRYHGDVLATWKTTKDKISFEREKFAREQPDLYSQYLAAKPGARPFLLK